MVSAMEAREGPIIHLSSVFMTIGRADTPWHSVLESRRFRVPVFDQRQSMFYPSHALQQSDVPSRVSTLPSTLCVVTAIFA